MHEKLVSKLRKPYQNITEWKKQQRNLIAEYSKKKSTVVRKERATPGKCSAQWADKNGMVNSMLK